MYSILNFLRKKCYKIVIYVTHYCTYKYVYHVRNCTSFNRRYYLYNLTIRLFN